MSGRGGNNKSLVAASAPPKKGAKRPLERAAARATAAIAKKGSGANIAASRKARLDRMWAEGAARLRDGLSSTGRLQFAPYSHYTGGSSSTTSRYGAAPLPRSSMMSVSPLEGGDDLDGDYTPSDGASSGDDDDDYDDDGGGRARADRQTIAQLRAELAKTRSLAAARGRKLAAQAPSARPPPYAVPPFGLLEMRPNPRVFPTGRHLAGAGSAARPRIAGPRPNDDDDDDDEDGSE